MPGKEQESGRMEQYRNIGTLNVADTISTAAWEEFYRLCLDYADIAQRRREQIAASLVEPSVYDGAAAHPSAPARGKRA